MALLRTNDVKFCLPYDEVSAMIKFGVPLPEMLVVENLAAMLVGKYSALHYMQGCAPAAYRAYLEVKRRQAIIKAKAEREARKAMQRNADMERHGYVHSMADGKIYGDRAKYRRELAAQGYTEVGNESVEAYANKAKAALAAMRAKEATEARKKVLAEITHGATITL